jgi:hypothetical protein
VKFVTPDVCGRSGPTADAPVFARSSAAFALVTSEPVIIVTGPGRSGTSVLAQLYKELGFDPGGRWIPNVRAGYEHGDFWRLNNELALGVGATMLKLPPAPRPAPGSPKPPAPTGYRRLVKGAKSRVVKALSDPVPTAPAKSRPAPNPNGRVRMIDWDRVPAVLDEHGDTMVRLAKETPFVKDPRFIFTLPLWVAAGADIEHVTITVRKMDDMVSSRHAAGQTKQTAVELRNSLTYGLGVISATVYETEQSHSFIRFPDFLHDLEGLYAALRFPEPVDFEHFRTTAEELFDPDQVHWSGDTRTAS